MLYLNSANNFAGFDKNIVIMLNDNNFHLIALINFQSSGPMYKFSG